MTQRDIWETQNLRSCQCTVLVNVLPFNVNSITNNVEIQQQNLLFWYRNSKSWGTENNKKNNKKWIQFIEMKITKIDLLETLLYTFVYSTVCVCVCVCESMFMYFLSLDIHILFFLIEQMIFLLKFFQLLTLFHHTSDLLHNKRWMWFDSWFNVSFFCCFFPWWKFYRRTYFCKDYSLWMLFYVFFFGVWRRISRLKKKKNDAS